MDSGCQGLGQGDLLIGAGFLRGRGSVLALIAMGLPKSACENHLKCVNGMVCELHRNTDLNESTGKSSKGGDSSGPSDRLVGLCPRSP